MDGRAEYAEYSVVAAQIKLSWKLNGPLKECAPVAACGSVRAGGGSRCSVPNHAVALGEVVMSMTEREQKDAQEAKAVLAESITSCLY